MRRGKKVTVLAALLVLVMGCAACAKSSEDYIAERLEQMNSQTIASGDEEAVQTTTEIMEDIMENVSKVEEKTPVEKKELSVGTLENGVYTNEYLGLTCTFDSNWMFYSAEELQEMTGAVVELLGDTSISDYLEKMDYFMDMKAENINDLTTVNVTYTKMTEQEQKKYAKLTEKEIIEKTLSSLDYVADSYSQMGMTIKSKEAKNVFFLGESRTAQYMHCDYMGTPYYTLQIYDYHIGEYATVVTLASYDADRTLELLSLFTKYE